MINMYDDVERWHGFLDIFLHKNIDVDLIVKEVIS